MATGLPGIMGMGGMTLPAPAGEGVWVPASLVHPFSMVGLELQGQALVPAVPCLPSRWQHWRAGAW